ncbi:MAG: hypothetical protein M1828_004848 [Chrysothrix sp. TS-e1954]|nr:MAG: hypothetical protein M1828_004848 [Chrysothrix sp. TS-e1954]
MYARVTSKQLGFDDLFIFLALCLAIFGDAAAQLQVNNGFGQHLVYLQPMEAIQAGKWTVINQLRSTISIFFIKVSICFFLLRVLANTHFKLKILIIANAVVYGIMVTIFCFIFGFQCRPFDSLWNTTIPHRCIDKQVVNNVGLAGNIINCITDFTYALLPIYIVQQLQMPTKNKIALSFILGLGVLTASCSIGKAATFNETSPDITWVGRKVQIFAALEENIGIVVASLPALRQLFTTFAVKFTTFRSKGVSSGRSTVQSGSGKMVSKSGQYPMGDMQTSSHAQSTDEDGAHLIAAENKGILKSTRVDVEASYPSGHS